MMTPLFSSDCQPKASLPAATVHLLPQRAELHGYLLASAGCCSGVVAASLA
jgi:hypothetical protein